jgi:hypothetical protein
MAIAHTNDKTKADIIARVTEKMAGIDKQVTGYDVQVDGIILRPKDSTEKAGDVLPDWSDASTTDGVSVTITGTYVMYSEGN